MKLYRTYGPGCENYLFRKLGYNPVRGMFLWQRVKAIKIFFFTFYCGKGKPFYDFSEMFYENKEVINE